VEQNSTVSWTLSQGSAHGRYAVMKHDNTRGVRNTLQRVAKKNAPALAGNKNPIFQAIHNFCSETEIFWLTFEERTS
jgi:hypothetical protein